MWVQVGLGPGSGARLYKSIYIQVEQSHLWVCDARINQEFCSSTPPTRVDRWDYSADIGMHILSLHADEILQLKFYQQHTAVIWI